MQSLPDENKLFRDEKNNKAVALSSVRDETKQGLHLYKDYYFSIRKNEVIFEIAVPMLISAVCSFMYFSNGKVFIALNGLAELLPTAISILIGFTVMLITLLLTSSGDNVELLKTIESDKVLYKKPVTFIDV